jgi:amino acid adenylation domain-containing protein
MSSNLALPFYEQALRDPHRPALVVNRRSWTYAELAERAGRVGAWLCDTVAPGARVGLLASRSFEAYEALLGTCFAGCTFVPLSPDQPEERLAALVRRAQLDALIAARPLPARVREEGPPHALWPGTSDALARRAPIAPRPVASDALAYVMFTSGTTGAPKGVKITAGAVAHYVACMGERCPLEPGDRASQFYDLTFDVSVHDIFVTLGSGAALHVVPKADLMAPVRFIRDERITVWSSVPSVIAFTRKMRLLRPGIFPDLRLSIFIGEPLPVESARAWRAAAPNGVVENHYGPTEGTVAFTAERFSDDAPRITPSRGTVSIGRPHPGLHAGIVDGSGLRFVEPGEAGELVLSGPQLAEGYLDDPDLTAHRFRTIEHPAHGSGRWYHTGDLAYEDADGCFHHLGRIDNQVKVLGRRVELEEIEAHLRLVSASESAAAVAWPVENGSAHGIVAFVAATTRRPQEIQDAMKQVVPPHMVPRRVIRLEALPLTPNGKLDRKALLARLEAEKAER